MKHRFLAMVCAGVLTAGLLTGCTGSEEKENTKTEAEDTAKTEEDTAGEEDTEAEVLEEEDNAVQEPVDEETAEAAGFTDGDEDTDAEEADKEEAGETVLDTDAALSGKHHVQISIKDYGTIEVELDADTAPISVTNFVKLVQEDFYDGLTFHRIMDGFMMQGGDPNGDGTGGSEDTIKGEFSSNGVENDISHVRGVISMARATDPDSASSQFFIVQSDSDFLDGDYAAFGHVTEGMEVVDTICKEAEPVDNNGTIKAEEQPVIENIQVLD